MAKDKEEVTSEKESVKKSKKDAKSEETADKKKSEKKKEKSEKDSSANKDSKEGKKSKKAKDEKKQSKIGKWFRDLKIEFKKVVWPSKETVVTNTSVVLAVVVASAVLMGVLDEGFLFLMRLIYR